MIQKEIEVLTDALRAIQKEHANSVNLIDTLTLHYIQTVNKITGMEKEAIWMDIQNKKRLVKPRK